MQKIIIFNFPEDKTEFKLHNNAYSYWHSLFNFHNYLRTKLKHENLQYEDRKIIEKTFDKFQEILQENNVDIFEIE